MSGWLNRLLRCQSGSPAVEFALVLPIFLIVVVGIVEVGSLLAETTAVEKGLRVGAMIAARANLPLDGDTVARIRNAAMTDINGKPRARGWTDPSTIVIETRIETLPDGTEVTVFRLRAVVPYDPLVPGFINFLGGLNLQAVHDQGYVGN